MSARSPEAGRSASVSSPKTQPAGAASPASAGPFRRRIKPEIEQKIVAMRALLEQGMTIVQASFALGMTSHAGYTFCSKHSIRSTVKPTPFKTGENPRKGVQAVAYRRDGGAPVELAQRKCLCCERPFLSDGKHNRICGSCKGSPVFSAGAQMVAA